MKKTLFLILLSLYVTLAACGSGTETGTEESSTGSSETSESSDDADTSETSTPTPTPAPDNDGDGTADAADSDDDNDATLDTSDCLPLDNAGEINITNASGATTCVVEDTDDDNDTVADTLDCLPLDARSQINVTNASGATTCVVDDTDDDNDTVADTLDCLPLDARSQINVTNASGATTCVADDTDDDNDSTVDSSDNCPLIANESQADLDADALGNSCDTDDNGNGIADADDPDNNRLTFWVSATEGNDAAATDRGSIQNPYATLGTAVTDASAAGRNVYIVDGTYSLSSTLVVPSSLSLYGGWGLLTSGSRTRDLTPLASTVTGPVGSAAIAFGAGVTTSTVVDGIIINAANNPAGNSEAVSISNRSPTLSNCQIVSGTSSATSSAITISASGSGETAAPMIQTSEIRSGEATNSSIAITLAAANAGVSSTTLQNNTLIQAGRATGDPSLSAGISATAETGGSLALTIEDNDSIQSGGAVTRSIGINLIENDTASGTSATATIRRNSIFASTDPSLSGPTTYGMMLGDSSHTIRSATVEANVIIGGSGTSESGGIYLRPASNTAITLLANNIILGRTGTGGASSSGINSVGSSNRIWAVNNTIDGGNAPTSSSAVLVQPDLSSNPSTPHLLNNIFTSSSSSLARSGVTEACGSCDPLELETNLFDSTLAVYYDDADTADITTIANVNSLADIAAVSENRDGDPLFSSTDTAITSTYLRIGTGSAAINAGQDTNSIDALAADGVEITVTDDIDGDMRATGAYDIGADER